MAMTMTNDSAMIVKCHQKMAETMTMTMTNDTEMIVKSPQTNDYDYHYDYDYWFWNDSEMPSKKP